MARPSKLTSEIQYTLIAALQEGASIAHACDYAGIDAKTFYNWMQRGESGEEEDFFQFFQAVTRARGRGVVTDLATISHAVRAGDWKAAAWRLQHRYPQEYGAKLNISGDADHPVHVMQTMPQEQLDALIQRLLRETGYGTLADGEQPV